MRHSTIYRGLLAALILGMVTTVRAAPSDRPNVVLIVCDDLNDYITGIPGQTGHPQARTPHVARLAQSGVAFRHAYSNNPICAPSRSSFLTGIYPHTSGNLFFGKWFENPVLKNSRTLMHHFRANGYHVAGTGKLMHQGRPQEWSEFKHKADYGPFVFDGKERIAHPSVPEPYSRIGPVDGSYAPLEDVPFADDNQPLTGWVYGDWGKTKPLQVRSADDRDPTPDERNAAWAAARIRQFAGDQQSGASPKPFFLGIGFIRPHTPLHVPQKYFDRFPLDTLQMPVIQAGDAEDTYYRDQIRADQKGLRYFRILEESYPTMEAGIKAFTQAYLASVAAVDDCIGQIVRAIDKSPFRDNTIIVLTSDHGWNMGQKDYLFKNAPWEESTRIPFIIRAPGITRAGGVANHPISLIDLYPTLVDLCGLTGDTRKNAQGAPLDGYSVRPFLEDPENGTWDGPEGALSMIFVGEHAPGKLTRQQRWDPANQHWTLRTERWRYIRYRSGQEELYDHRQDPREWTNLAGNPSQATRLTAFRKQLRQYLPDPENPPSRFVPDAETWKDTYFHRHPESDANRDGTLTWVEYKAHKADRDASTARKPTD